jgi:hypothetical protein
MTVREANAALGTSLVVYPHFGVAQGHPDGSWFPPSQPFTAIGYVDAYLPAYDASTPSLIVRVVSNDPLDSVIARIAPNRPTLPASVQAGWIEGQVRAIYGTRLTTQVGLMCPLPTQRVFAVYDGEPGLGTPRIYFTFTDGRLAFATTATVNLGDTGQMDC